MSVKLLLTGSIAFDRIMVFPGTFEEVIQPDKLHILSVSVLIDQLKETRGGVAANIAYSLSLLGESSILYGSVGNDAQPFMSDLEQRGVNVEHVHYSSLHTATFTVMTDLNDCQIAGFYPGAMGDAKKLSLKPWKDEDVCVVVSPHDPAQMAKQVAEVKKYKKRLFYDVGQQANNISAEDIKAGIEAAELLIVNDYEMGVIEKKTGWSKRNILEKVPRVVVTLGAHGCELFSQSGTGDSCVIRSQVVPAVKLKKVVDPTGAGDAFRAGFLYGYVREWDPVRCAQLGAVTASFAVEQYGTQAHTCTKQEIARRYRETYGKILTF
jgi:adenosine kinase